MHPITPTALYTRHVTTALLLLSALSLQACTNQITCGPGSIERDGACVLALECGPGTVPEQGRCVSPEYACTPSCVAAQCGDDGCGGSCGDCDTSAPFCKDGTCVAECTPQCEGRSCGPDGCGGQCGACAPDTQCAIARGSCVPEAWTCDPDSFDSQGACDCGCGLPDPDCEDDSAQVRGCDLILATCSSQGTCVGGFDPANWTCAPMALNDASACDCACGIPDPDCLDASLPINGCAQGQTCDANGACKACSPQCEGRSCGSDGCGGQCGQCDQPNLPFCTPQGQCAARCEPSCDDKSCGPDGCGGQCGPPCAEGLECVGGSCEALPPSRSCQNLCGQLNPESGCSCEQDCLQSGTCCADVQRSCGCQPLCAGKTCGDDGCGGQCGTCQQGTICSPDGTTCQDDPCDPDPCDGRGTCSPDTGACTCSAGFAGERCDTCASGYTGYPRCTLSKCDLFTCNLHGTCDPAAGSCTCYDGFMGTTCDQCQPGHGTYPSCTP